MNMLPSSSELDAIRATNPNWGMLYMGLLLRDSIGPIAEWYGSVQHTDPDVVLPVPDAEYLSELRESITQLRQTYESLFHALTESMPPAMGATGQVPGLHLMTMAAAEITRCCIMLRLWEQRNAQMMPESGRLRECRSELVGFTRPSVMEVMRLADHLSETFSTPDPPKEVTFEMTFSPARDPDRLLRLLDNYAKAPSVARPKKQREGSLLRTLGVFYIIDRIWPMR